MKHYKKLLVLGCSMMLVAASLTGCGEQKTSQTEDEIENVKDTLDQLETAAGFLGHSDTAGKEETVYAILDADGNQEQTIVSTWLKNPEGSKNLSDSSDLTDIHAVKGNAVYKNGIWETDGSDVYYRGISKKELPVEVQISYELDGEEVTAKELAGKSGHLKMTFSYTNNISKDVTINGKNQTIYQPFFMVSGMMLDSEKAQNITVENGGAVNSGEETLVFGVAMPGLEESLGLDESLDIGIPKSVTVEADVTDFSLMMTLTVASNQALSQLGLDDINSIDDLKEDVEKLSQGMSEIMTGATQVDDGVTELKSGIATLKGKLPELTTGANALQQGTKELAEGLDAAAEKNDLLNGSATQLSEGLSKILTGYNYESGQVAQLIASLEAYATGLEATNDEKNITYAGYIRTMIATYQKLYQDVSKASTGAKQLESGITSYTAGISKAATGMKTLDESMQMLNRKLPTLVSGVNQLSDGAGKLSSGTKSLKSGVIQFNQDGIQKLVNLVNDDLETYFDRLKALQDYAGEYANFAGCDEGVECSVKFVYKTGEIE